MKKVTFLALHLGYGGIEKCISTVANHLCNEYEVEIISTYQIYEEPAFLLDPRIKVTYLIHDKPNRKELKEAILKEDPPFNDKENKKLYDNFMDYLKNHEFGKKVRL